MKNKLFVLVFLLCTQVFYSFAQNQEIKILFIGSSYFGYNDLPSIIKNLAASADKKVYVDNYNPGGLYLADHASSNITESIIKKSLWDFVILQGVGSLMAYPDHYSHHPVFPAIQALKSKIHNNCASTQIIYCLPWAYEDGMTWLNWSDTYEDMQLLIYNRTIEFSKALEFSIAPVGWAWYKTLEEENFPLHYLHLNDWNHPSLKGSYLMACVIYSSIFVESCEGIPYYAMVKKKVARRFQEIASKTVLDSLSRWNITR